MAVKKEGTGRGLGSNGRSVVVLVQRSTKEEQTATVLLDLTRLSV